MKDIQVRLMRAGTSGKDAWTPVISIVPDGVRLVMQITDWVGGEGRKPVAGLYIGSGGYVDEISKAVDVKGVGQKGWSPAFSVVSDGDRRVLQVFDWTGGEGVKPATGFYVTLNGLSSNIGAAIDIRGSQGMKGDKGDIGPQGMQGPKGEIGSPAIPDSITNTHLANMPANTIKGRPSTDGDPQDLTAAQTWEMIGAAGKASEAEARAGIDDTRFMTPAMTKRYIDANSFIFRALGSLNSDIAIPNTEYVALKGIFKATSQKFLFSFAGYFENENTSITGSWAWLRVLHKNKAILNSSWQFSTPSKGQERIVSGSLAASGLIVNNIYSIHIIVMKTTAIGPLYFKGCEINGIGI